MMMVVVLGAIGFFQVGTAQDAIAQNTVNSRNVVSKSMDFEHRKPIVYGNAQRAVGTGMHIENIYQINLRNQSFWAEGWYWIKWGPEVQNIIASEKIPLDRVLEFTNEIEVNNSVIEPESAEPVELEDGSFYQDFRFSAHFFVNDLNLARFPFYEINLPIIMETRPEAFSCYEGGPPCTSLLPEANTPQTLIGQFIELNGYDIAGSLVKQFLHQYNATFGTSNNLSAFPSVEYGIVYKTNVISSFGQYVLPLLVVLGIVIASPSLPGSQGDVRLAIPTTALLTLIFLQQSYREELPPLSILTFLDILYIFAYLVSICFFLLFCWGSNYYNKVSEDGGLLAEEQINRVDWRFQLAALIGLALLAPISFALL